MAGEGGVVDMKFSFRKFDVAYVSIHPFRTACIDSLSHHNHMFH